MGHQVYIGDRHSDSNHWLYRRAQADFVVFLCSARRKAYYEDLDRQSLEEHKKAIEEGEVGWYSHPTHDRDCIPATVCKQVAEELPATPEELFKRLGINPVDPDFMKENFDVACEFVKKAASMGQGIVSI